MYRIEGIRKSGAIFERHYTEENIARFEYELTLLVSLELRLYKDDKVLEEFVKQQDEVIIYNIKGESAFNKVNKVIKNNLKLAEQEFISEKDRCDWVSLYENKNGVVRQLNLYIKGAA